MNKEVCILGAGGHAKVVIEIAELSGYEIKQVFDQDADVEKILQYSVSNDLVSLSHMDNVFYALGNNQSRKNNSIKYNSAGFNLIHPSAILSRNIFFGKGNAVMAGVVINSSVRIGNHCIINTAACIDHDCEIGDFAHISPNVALAGNVRVLEGAQVGIGASVKQNITIGRWSVVGAGAVVVKDIPDHCIAVGNPARIIKNNSNNSFN
ncbi:acetyltransferase [Epilithonimonas mollis]|uniref:Sugar O-acyltransferase, sialic acid O-acetyltransferase NeuD family n=1 Tax=Epilithonimonas mollis TaxID=216903 RepID=A0A1M6SBB6_9FLAO|nr:acetyltransferase [Epilithonimonas mollis]SHK42073.1 sugar O-acyltransferase, sialic acid O-acetyltransferase NeuD family [Epilithonimonas mollis]